MLQVLNSKERNQAFLKFITFFVITTVLIVCAVYVDFKGLPEAKKNYLERKYELMRTETQIQKEFVSHMEKARTLLDSLDKTTNREQIEILLTGKLNDMERSRIKDSSLNGKQDSRILEAFLELQKFKKERVTLIEMANKARELEQKLQVCESDLDNYRSRPPVIPGYNPGAN